MPKKIGRDPAQFGLFATPQEAMIAPDAEVRVIAALTVDMMWLTGNLRPKQKTIAEFRRIHPKQLKQVFREYILLLQEWDLIGGKRIAVDGTKVHAQHARTAVGSSAAHKNFNEAKLKQHLDRIDNRVEEAMEEFSRLDKYEESEEKSFLVARTQDALDV